MEGFYRKQREVPIQKEGNTMSMLKGFLSGLLVGSLAGAGAMLLLAPASGKRTRSKIRHQYDELRDQMVESVEDAMEDAEKEVVGKAHHFASDARGMVKEFQHRGQEMFDRR
jgi:gas vesicle protein